jgi:ABC-type Mn2+/Zn2+ transport system ATPase subunit
MSNNHHDSECLLIRHLDIGYDNGPIVAGIDVELCAGQSLALVGINGSGKSTLLKTIVGLQPPLAGEIDVMGKRPGMAPKRIAYLSQFHASGFVLPLRAVDVVRMGRFPARGLLGRMTHEDADLVWAAMHTMGVRQLGDAPLRSLSGGQQQRVYLAQVLARQADLLVLDEPTSGLDASGRDIYAQAMESELARGAAIITATHDIQEAARCDCVMLLAQRVIACGAPDAVLTPERLLETFGIVLTLRDQHLSLAVVEREHGHDHGEQHP